MLYPVFMKTMQNAWYLSALMDIRRTYIKQQNKNAICQCPFYGTLGINGLK